MPGDECFHQRGLPDAGFAGDESDSTAALLDRRVPLAQAGPLCLTPDEALFRRPRR